MTMADYDAVELLIAKIDSEGLDYALENYPDVFRGGGMGVGLAAQDARTALTDLKAAITGGAAEYADLAERWQDMGGES